MIGPSQTVQDDPSRLAASELEQLFREDPLPIWVVDAETLGLLGVNRAAARNCGCSLEEVGALSLRDVLAPGEVQPLLRALAAASGRLSRFPSRLLRRDGSSGEVEITAQPVRHLGRPACALRVDDVTERNGVLCGLRAAEERQRFLAEAVTLLTTKLDYRERLAQLARLAVGHHADCAIIDIVTDDGHIQRVAVAHADPRRERAASELIRYPPTAARPVGIQRVLRTGRPLLGGEVDDAMRRAIARDEEHLQILRELDARSYIVVPLQARHETLGAITFLRAGPNRAYTADDLALAEALARHAAHAIDNARLYDRAQRAIRAREEILRIVSHELRDPLGAIRLTLELLLDSSEHDAWTARQRQRLEALHRFAEHLVAMVDDLVDLERIEAGLLRLRPAREDAGPLVRLALESVQPLAAARLVHLVADLPRELPAVHADGQRVQQVFGNLLAHAVRAAPPRGSVTVGATAAAGQVRFAISPASSGLPAEQLLALLQPGRRSPDEAGIGVAIAAAIVRGHGGEIWADAPAEGAQTLYFSLPVAREEPAAAEWGRGGEAVLPAAPPLCRPPVDDAPGTGGAGGARAGFLEELGGEGAPAGAPAELGEQLRHQILAGVHLGRLRPGDRLPSIRQIAQKLGTTNHTVARLYERLAAEGVVERRHRSGIFVAEPARSRDSLLVETGRWLAKVLAEACEHEIRIPQLPSIVRQWTASVRLRCACVEADRDHLVALCTEIAGQFGMECVPVAVDALRAEPPASGTGAEPPAAVTAADLLVTTAFHAPLVRSLADRAGIPMVVVTLDAAAAAAVENRLHERETTLVCADERFAERLRTLLAPSAARRLRVVLTTDAEALSALDPDEPILLTRAAREEIGERSVRLLLPRFPALALESEREIARLLVQLNLSRGRSLPTPLP